MIYNGYRYAYNVEKSHIRGKQIASKKRGRKRNCSSKIFLNYSILP